MLVLTRHAKEGFNEIHVEHAGEKIRIVFMGKGRAPKTVKIGIDAPHTFRIIRGEILADSKVFRKTKE